MKKALISFFVLIIILVCLGWSGIWKFALWSDYKEYTTNPNLLSAGMWSLDEPNTFYYLLKLQSTAKTHSPLAIDDNGVLAFTEIRLYKHDTKSNTNTFISSISKDYNDYAEILSGASNGKLIFGTNGGQYGTNNNWKTYEIDLKTKKIIPIFTNSNDKIFKVRLLNNNNYLVCKDAGLLGGKATLSQVNFNGETKKTYDLNSIGCQYINFLTDKSTYGEFAIDNNGNQLTNTRELVIALSPDSKQTIQNESQNFYLGSYDKSTGQASYNPKNDQLILFPKNIKDLVPPYPTKIQVYLRLTK